MPRNSPLLLFLFLLQGCFNVQSNKEFMYKKLSPVEYSKLLSISSNYYLIDVRTASEFHKSHIPGAINYNFLAFKFAKQVDSLDRNKPVFIYCQTCHRSPFCGRILKRKGFVKVYDIKKGYIKWLKKDLPITTQG